MNGDIIDIILSSAIILVNILLNMLGLMLQ